jgi:hypothetical protein
MLKVLFLDKNIIEKNILYVKIIKTWFQGHKGNSHQNLTIMKLKFGCQPKRTTNSINSKVELLCSEVGETGMIFMK